MENRRLTFACSVCGEVVQHNLSVKEGFEFLAYDELMQWSDFTNDVIDLKEQYWQRSEIAPSANEIRIVKVYFPFNFKIEEEFWVLFMPALSFFNGWEDYPDEVDQSAMVRCKFKGIIAENEKSAWITVEVIEVIMLPDLCNIIPSTEYQTSLDELQVFKDYYMIDFGEWLKYYWSAQGDLGIWLLMKKHDDGKTSLVLYTEWGFHHDTVYCGNIDIPQPILQKWIDNASELICKYNK